MKRVRRTILCIQTKEAKEQISIVLGRHDLSQQNRGIVLPGLEPGTFRVLSERDNHYTTELLAEVTIMKKISVQSGYIDRT